MARASLIIFHDYLPQNKGLNAGIQISLAHSNVGAEGRP
jgi:hypothetical protein